MIADGTSVMEAFDHKYRYRLEQMDGVTLEDRRIKRSFHSVMKGYSKNKKSNK